MAGIYKKEISHYFKTMTGYVFIAMYLAVSGAMFTTVNLLSQNGDIRAYFSAMTTVVTFLLPILTMGMFAEERKQKTDELLLTSPISLTAVVLGKFFSTFTVFLIPLSVTGIYPLLLSAFGASAPMVTLGSFFGFMLLAMAFIAIGLFLSMLTDSQFVASVMTYSLFALLLLANGTTALSGSAVLNALLRFVALTGHYNGFSYGVFQLTEIIYYVSIAALFLFLSIYMLERKRLT